MEIELFDLPDTDLPDEPAEENEIKNNTTEYQPVEILTMEEIRKLLDEISNSN